MSTKLGASSDDPNPQGYNGSESGITGAVPPGTRADQVLPKDSGSDGAKTFGERLAFHRYGRGRSCLVAFVAALADARPIAFRIVAALAVALGTAWIIALRRRAAR